MVPPNTHPVPCKPAGIIARARPANLFEGNAIASGMQGGDTRSHGSVRASAYRVEHFESFVFEDTVFLGGTLLVLGLF